ncbi:MAG: AraC-like DNA-binding protein [Polaribacter sp.]|jgi:AraC-like DNA-binding protein
MKLFLDFSLTTGIVLTSIILFILFKQKNKTQTKKILIVIFIQLMLVFIFYYGYLHKLKELVVVTFIFEDPIIVLLGPMLFFYVTSIVKDSKITVSETIVHCIVPLLYILTISFPALINIVSDIYVFEYLSRFENLIPFIILYSLVYCIISLQLLEKFRTLVKLNYSNLNNKNLKWVQYLLLGTIFIISIDVLTSIYELATGNSNDSIGYFTIIPIVFLIGYLGYYGIFQSKILLPDFLLIEETKNGKFKVEKKANIYNEVEMLNLKLELERIIEIQKPYLIEDLTLKDLAELLQITDKKMSALLNQNLNISFYDYINNFRVKEVKKRMQNQAFEKYTLLAIALECGFNSKASFNRVFKKMTKVSPSEYKKQMLVNKK